jgi:ABC-type multidrug transport system fused ATPase/permease subunit
MEDQRQSEFRWLFRHTKRLWALHAISLISIVAGSVLALIDPLIMKWLIDRALPQKSLHLLLLGVGSFLVVYLGRLALNYAGSLLSFLAIQKLIFRIRFRLLRRLHSLPLAYHESMPIGDMLFRLENDVDQVGQLGGDLLPNIIRMTVTAIVVTATMCFLNLRLTCLVLPLLPLFYFLRKNFRTKLKKVSDQVQGQAGAMNSFLQEHLNGIPQLMLLNRTSREAGRFASIASTGLKLQLRRRFAEIEASGFSMLVIVTASAFILGYGGREVIRGRLTIGGLVAFYAYVTRLFDPLSGAVELQSRTARVGASIRRVLEIDKAQERYRQTSGIRPRVCRSISLEFDNVIFRHRLDRPLLEDVSFAIGPGERVALVGLSGSGKTTIGRLATRLYDPSGGRILVEGRDAREFSLRGLRGTVALVPQDPILFDGSLRENLLFGNPGATEHQIGQVVHWSQLDDLVRRIKSLDESLGPQGNRLSGGERKRVALARAMLQQSAVLILDEITAALDGPTAAYLLRGLDEFRGNRSVLVISHRPSTISWADRVVVLDGGRIVRQGTHAELARSSSLYHKICREQQEGEDIPSTDTIERPAAFTALHEAALSSNGSKEAIIPSLLVLGAPAFPDGQ